jgi:hypothetical protein
LEEEGWGNGQAKFLRSLQVDDQLDCRGLFDREVGRLGAFEQVIYVVGFPGESEKFW